MGNSRDDFTSATKELLANRVGRRCSNPACRKLTCGANTNPEKITNIGVAAHICAAAQGGPRYDASMTPEERKSFENGIWLCQSCSKLIDTDITRYPKELLQSWKQLAEQTAILEVETTSSTPAFEKDKELVQFYLECFDRPAFQDDIYQEGRMEDFDKAIEDTLCSLCTPLQAFHKTHCVPLIPHRFLYSHPHNFQKPVICDWCLSVIVSEAFHKNSAPNPSQLQDPKVSHILANGHSIFLRFYDNHTLLEAPEKSLPDPPSSMQRTAHPKARRISWYFHSVPLLSCVF